MGQQGTLDAFCPDQVSSDAAAITGCIDRIIWPSGSKPPRLSFVQPDIANGNQTALPLSTILGEDVRIQLQSEQYCTKCGARSQQKVCRECAGTPPLTTCIKQPATRCSYSDCPFPEYKEKSCAHEFVVYLATADGVKVGITKRTRTLARWQEQGANYALPIATAPNRRAAGILERAISQAEDIGQRLPNKWYEPMDHPAQALVDAAFDVREFFPDRLASCFRWESPSEPEIREDIVSVPYLETSALDHHLTNRLGELQAGNAREGRIVGVRGALIATDEFVINTSRHAGHGITIETEAPFVESFDADSVTDDAPVRADNTPSTLGTSATDEETKNSEQTSSNEPEHPIEEYF